VLFALVTKAQQDVPLKIFLILFSKTAMTPKIRPVKPFVAKGHNHYCGLDRGLLCKMGKWCSKPKLLFSFS